MKARRYTAAMAPWAAAHFDDPMKGITAQQLAEIFARQTGENDNQVHPAMPDDPSVIIDGEFDFEEIARQINALLFGAP